MKKIYKLKFRRFYGEWKEYGSTHKIETIEKWKNDLAKFPEVETKVVEE